MELENINNLIRLLMLKIDWLIITCIWERKFIQIKKVKFN